jgi:hypothetical protein
MLRRPRSNTPPSANNVNTENFPPLFKFKSVFPKFVLNYKRENGDEDVNDDFSGEKDVDGDTVDKEGVDGDTVDEECVYEEGVDDGSFHEVDEDISDEYPEEEIVNPEEELRRELNSHIGTYKRTEELHKLGHKRYNLIQDCTWKSTDCRTG